MYLISNNKIGFARYPGFSLLFDNPDNPPDYPSMSQLAKLEKEELELVKIDCILDSNPDLEFYKALKDGLDEIGHEELMATYLFFALPPSSYHVTVVDGLNQGHVQNQARQLQPAFQQELKNFIALLPVSLQQGRSFTTEAATSPLINCSLPVTFEFDRLSIWSSNVLVARLKIPEADKQSKDNLAYIKDERKKLLKRFNDEFFPPDRRQKISTYNPHVSLGYFANKERGKAAETRRRRWTNILRQYTTGNSITFTSISLYGFTDMATYFKQQ